MVDRTCLLYLQSGEIINTARNLDAHLSDITCIIIYLYICSRDLILRNTNLFCTD